MPLNHIGAAHLMFVITVIKENCSNTTYRIILLLPLQLFWSIMNLKPKSIDNKFEFTWNIWHEQNIISNQYFTFFSASLKWKKISSQRYPLFQMDNLRQNGIQNVKWSVIDPLPPMVNFNRSLWFLTSHPPSTVLLASNPKLDDVLHCITYFHSKHCNKPITPFTGSAYRNFQSPNMYEVMNCTKAPNFTSAWLN